MDTYATDVSTLRTAVFEYSKFEEFLNRKSGIIDAKDAGEAPTAEKPTIEFRNVSFSYGGRQILDDVSFVVKSGETLGLVGSSGCGKSTCLKLLLRFYSPDSGQILINGVDIATVTGASLRKLFSVVSQSAQLTNGTIRDEIAYGRRDATDEDIREAAGLAELDISHPDLQLDKSVGEGGGRLSGGQQQRVNLARAMLKRGTIYLLDEPTTGLDNAVARSLQKTLDKLAENATTICITHHLGDLKTSDDVIYLDAGHIVEYGSFEELMKAKGTFYQQVNARGDE